MEQAERGWPVEGSGLMSLPVGIRAWRRVPVILEHGSLTPFSACPSSRTQGPRGCVCTRGPAASLLRPYLTASYVAWASDSPFCYLTCIPYTVI